MNKKGVQKTLDFDDFINRLVEEKGLENLAAESQAQVKKDLKERLERQVNAAILSRLPEQKLPEFEKLLDSGGDSEIQAFCAANIEDLDQVIARSLLAFRATYLGI